MVGTAVKKVIGFWEVDDVDSRKGDARRSQTDLALKGKRNSTEDPAKRGVRSAFITPWIWWRGRTCSR